MKIDRNYVTPFIALIFLVLAITGLFMYFHLFDGYTEVAHEMMGLGFVAAATFHILVNWKSLKTHFGKKVFLPAALAVFAISSGFIISGRLHTPVDQVLQDKLIKAPLADSFKVLGVNYTEASQKLKKHGLSIAGSNTLEDIWRKNEADPEEVVAWILE
jgi:hypothetical protein